MALWRFDWNLTIRCKITRNSVLVGEGLPVGRDVRQNAALPDRKTRHYTRDSPDKRPPGHPGWQLGPGSTQFSTENRLLAFHGAPNASMDAMPMATAPRGPRSGRISPAYSQTACAWLGCSASGWRQRTK